VRTRHMEEMLRHLHTGRFDGVISIELSKAVPDTLVEITCLIEGDAARALVLTKAGFRNSPTRWVHIPAVIDEHLTLLS
jgi:hypothetical protein